jgi:osmoprotectant transport system ATP-binding protein
VIEYRGVSKTFADGTEPVGELSVVVPSHTTTLLVGSNGCGKTTLLRMVNRMVDPSAGQVLIDDVDVATRNPIELRRSIGYVMQHAGLLPHRTVVENVVTVLRLNGVDKAAAHERARDVLQTVGLDAALASRYPGQLSGGQQQRVGVARGLAADPNILLMDEPFGAVDPIVRAELQRELLRLQRELGKTIVFVTHDIDEAFQLGEQVVILKKGGEVAQVGTPAQILASPADEFVRSFVGLDRANRTLHVAQESGRSVVTDAAGRAVGVLS